jgi:hypothetical protein
MTFVEQRPNDRRSDRNPFLENIDVIDSKAVADTKTAEQGNIAKLAEAEPETLPNGNTASLELGNQNLLDEFLGRQPTEGIVKIDQRRCGDTVFIKQLKATFYGHQQLWCGLGINDTHRVMAERGHNHRKAECLQRPQHVLMPQVNAVIDADGDCSRCR